MSRFGGRLIIVLRNLFNHVPGVDAELNPAGVANGGVEGAEDEFCAAQFDAAPDQPVDNFHDGGLNGFLVPKQGDGVQARVGPFDGAEHALVEIAEPLSAKSGVAHSSRAFCG
jgi:hypothetical protein